MTCFLPNCIMVSVAHWHNMSFLTAISAVSCLWPTERTGATSVHYHAFDPLTWHELPHSLMHMSHWHYIWPTSLQYHAYAPLAWHELPHVSICNIIIMTHWHSMSWLTALSCLWPPGMAWATSLHHHAFNHYMSYLAALSWLTDMPWATLLHYNAHNPLSHLTALTKQELPCLWLHWHNRSYLTFFIKPLKWAIAVCYHAYKPDITHELPHCSSMPMTTGY